MAIPTTTIGYPRIGKSREVKKALEAFWSDKLDEETLRQTVRQVEIANWKTQRDFERSLSYSWRLSEQISLPPLPTTMIGSFPQTSEVRQLRVKYKKGEITLFNYQALREVSAGSYSHQIGNGTYHIHSPVVPTTEQIVQQLKAGIANLPLSQIWVNPDCGLKTRRWEEVIPALKNMVEATKIIR